MSTTVKGLGELIAYLPYVLGFHPRHSVVAVAHGRVAIGMIARIDVQADEELFAADLAQVAAVVEREGDPRLELLLFDDTPLGRRRLEQAGNALFGGGRLGIIGHWALCSGPAQQPATWMTVRCRCGADCPTEVPRPVPDPASVAAVAERVWDGVAPLPDRDGLRAAVAHDAVVGAAVLAPAPPPPRSGAAVQELLRRCCLPEGFDPSPPALARVLADLGDLEVRDEVLTWMAPELFGEPASATAAAPETADASAATIPAAVPAPSAQSLHARRVTVALAALTRAAAPDQVAAPATLLAFWSWRCGDGAAAAIAVERALEADPRYRLAGLVASLLAAGIRPASLAATAAAEPAKGE
ncbi:DUF4192 domain-containing protein [Dermacoccaceae bacterium W4C1]